MRLDLKCPFCRKPGPKSEADCDRNMMKRAEANNPDALRSLGTQRREGGDYKGAFEYWTKAAELGNVSAHYDLAVMYQLGAGVEKDEKKMLYFLEKAAIAGHPEARCNLGCHELSAGDYGRAVKHFIIAATLGDDAALANLKTCYQKGILSKEDFAAALRAHKATVDATKSPQREAADTEAAERRGLT